MPIPSGFGALSFSLTLEGDRNGPCGKTKRQPHVRPQSDPLLRVQHERSGKSEDRRTQRPDAQKVVRLFGQAIWTTKK